MRVIYNTTVIYRSGFSESDLEALDELATRVLQKRGDLGLNPLKLSEQALADVVPLQTTFEERTADLRDIEADLRDAVQRFPESIDMHLLLAQNLKDQGRIEEAASHMKEQADRHPGHSEWARAHVEVYADHMDYFTTNAERLAGFRTYMDLKRQYADLPIGEEYEDLLYSYKRGGGMTTHTLVDDPPEPLGRRAMAKIGDWLRSGPDEPH